MKKLFFFLLLVLVGFSFLHTQAQCVTGANTLSTGVQTTFAGQRGIMFDVVATNNITIHCFAPPLYQNDSGTYFIYYRYGTHVGHANSVAGWTFVDSVTNLVGNTLQIIGAGLNNANVLIPIDVNVPLLAGDTVAFYISARGPDLNYGGIRYIQPSASVSVGSVWLSDANLQVLTGVGKAYFFSTSFTPRQYVGDVYYTGGVPTCYNIASIASAGGQTAVCANSSLKLFSLNNQSNYTYQWFRNDTLISGATDSSYFATQAGAYKLRVTNPTALCTDTSAVINITQKAISNVTLAQYGGVITGGGITTLTQACVGTPIHLVASTSGPTVTDYQWQRNGTDLAGQTNDTLTLTSGWGVYRVRVTNSNNCSTNADTFAVSFRALPNAQAGTDRNVCEGTNTYLGTTPVASYTYSWNPSTNLSNATIANPVLSVGSGNPTTYTVFVSQAVANAGGLTCTKNDTINLTLLPAPPAPTIAVSAPSNLVNSTSPVLCEGTGTISLLASGTSSASQIQWLRNNVQISLTSSLLSPLNITNTGGVSASYTAKIKSSSNGCFSAASNTINATINNAALPMITPAGTNNIILLCFAGSSSASQTLTASVSSGTPSYTWFQSPNTSTSVGTGANYVATIDNTNSSKSFRVTATYPNGCVRNTSWKIVRKNTACREDNEEITDNLTIQIMPNPVQEALRIAISGELAMKSEVRLYDALGKEVLFQSINNPTEETELTLNVKMLPAGIYYLKVSNENRQETVKLIKE